MLKKSNISQFSRHFLCISLKLLRIFPFWFFHMKEHKKKTIRNIYNIPKNIFFSKKKKYFQFCKKTKLAFFQVFLAYIFKTTWNLTNPIVFRERASKILWNKVLLGEINRCSLANQCTYLSLSQIGFVPIAETGSLSSP